MTAEVFMAALHISAMHFVFEIYTHYKLEITEFVLFPSLGFLKE